MHQQLPIPGTAAFFACYQCLRRSGRVDMGFNSGVCCECGAGVRWRSVADRCKKCEAKAVEEKNSYYLIEITPLEA